MSCFSTFCRKEIAVIEKLRQFHSPVGLRTLKTAVAVSVAIMLVEQYGTSAEELFFGVMGAFAAMEPTFKASVRGCVAQISGVIVAVILSMLVLLLGIPGDIEAGIGVILVMGTYQLLHLKMSPVLPCYVLVTICTTPGIDAVGYGLARIWNTALGLAAGMVINMLVFPYDNSKKIQQVMNSLDRDLVEFLQDMFDGDEHLPDTEEMERKIDSLQSQLAIFADQRLLRRRRQKVLLSRFQTCEDTARELLLEVEVLRSIEHVGKLNHENQQALQALGATISVQEDTKRFSVEDLVINYHVKRALELREKLKRELSTENR